MAGRLPHLRRLDLRPPLQATLLDFRLANPKALDFAAAADRHRKCLNEADELRNLVVRDLASAKLTEFPLGRGHPGAQPNLGQHRFAELDVGQSPTHTSATLGCVISKPRSRPACKSLKTKVTSEVSP